MIKGIVLTPEQCYYLRMHTGSKGWQEDPGPVFGSIGMYGGLTILDLPLGVEHWHDDPIPEGFVDLRAPTPLPPLPEASDAL